MQKKKYSLKIQHIELYLYIYAHISMTCIKSILWLILHVTLELSLGLMNSQSLMRADIKHF